MDLPQMPVNWTKNTKKMAIIFPNRKEGGVYSLAMHIIYNIVNKIPGWICEQRFLEDATDLGNFDLIGFTWQYELDLYNIIKILKNNQIKGRTFAGGPAVNQNFNPLKDYIDFFVLGEVEEILPKILQHFDNDKELSKIQGVFIPKLTKIKTIAHNKAFPEYPLYQPMPKDMDSSYVFGNAFILEIERGCPYNCNFCPMPSKFQTKYRPLEQLKEIIDQGLKLNKRNKIVIYSPSFTHPKRKEILEYILSKNATFSVPSIKAEYMTDDTLSLIHKSGQRSLTIAPECGASLRPSIGKNVKDEKYIEFAEKAKDFSSLKLYFMLGLPKQDNKDLDEIIHLISEMKKIYSGKIYASFNPFVPKPGTKFENKPFRKKEISEQIKYLRKNLKIKVKFGSVSQAEKIYKISRFL